MGLFSHNKDKNEEKQTNEIKSAAISQEPISAPPLDAQQTPINNTPAQEFNNPFANQGQPNPQNQPAQSIPVVQENNPQNQMNQSVPEIQQPTLQNPSSLDNSGEIAANPFANQQMDLNQNQEETSMMDEEKIQELIDETVEKIIAERWEKVTSSVERVLNWKGKIEGEIDLLKADITTIKTSFETFEKRLINKISNYDKNILDVNSEIKALEMVFQKITPTLVNNVNELSRIADDLKGVEPTKNKEDNN